MGGGRPGHRPLGSGGPNVDGVGECPLPPNRRLKTAFGIARFTSSESLLGLVAWPLTHLQSLTHTVSGCGQKTCRVHNQPQPPRTGPAETPAPVSRAAPGLGLGAEGQAQMAPPHGTCQHSQLAPSAHLLLLGEACWPQGSSRQQEHASRSDEPARAAEATAPSCRERQEGDCHGTARPGRAPLPEPSVLQGLAPRTRISPPV